MGGQLMAGGITCKEAMFYLPAGFIEELETLLFNEDDDLGMPESRAAAEKFLAHVIASMSLDESPWKDQIMGGDLRKPMRLSSAGKLHSERASSLAEVEYDPGYWGTAFGEMEARLAVDCELASRQGRALPKWGTSVVPKSARQVEKDKWVSKSKSKPKGWWSFKQFGPWASRYWLPYPVVPKRGREPTEPIPDLARGGDAIRLMEQSMASALPWIKKAAASYEDHVFPMMAVANEVSKELGRAAKAIPAGAFIALTEREALMKRISLAEGYAVYCDEEEGWEPGFVGIEPGDNEPIFERPLGAAAMFSTVNAAHMFAAINGIDCYAVVKLGVEALGVKFKEGAVDVSPVQELCAKRERAELESISARADECRNAQEVKIVGRAPAWKAPTGRRL